MGRIILAFKSPAYVEEHFGGRALTQFSDQTPATFRDLQRTLAEDRRRGYVISHSSFEAGIASIAAPLFDAKGEIAGAINVSTPENLIDAERFDAEVCSALRATARRISELSGYREPAFRFVNLELAGRVAVVTGGTSGIGLSTVRRFLDEGASVAFCARSSATVATVAAELSAAYPERVFGGVADVLDGAQLDAFRDAVAARFGRVDVLVHNAGKSRMAGLDALADADWSEELELKFFGLLRPTRAFMPLLRASDAASMVYVSSLLAKQPEGRLVSTSAARAGALSLAKTMSFDYAPAVRVNSILLGVIDTGQWEKRYAERRATGDTITREAYITELAHERGIPMGRIGKPEEVAATVAFLASPLCGFMTGAVIEISGGFSRYV